jgi:molybdenum cofactor guanylyltransferase
MKIAGVILAGGQATRMGGANKALLIVGAKALFQHVADRLKPQASLIGINANRDLTAFSLPIAPDGIGANLGPLDGILGAMIFAQLHGCTHAITVSVDTPFIPLNLAKTLMEHSNSQIAIASSNGRIHGTCGLWPVSYAAGLKAFILSGKSLKLMDYLNATRFAEVSFTGDSPDPFFNLNTPDDLAAATRWL